MPVDVLRFEEITLNSSSALKQSLYDGWVLRFSPGSNVKRANSVTPLYPSSLPVEDKIDYCELAYAREGLPARFRVNQFCAPADLDDRLAAHGYQKIEPTLVMSLPLATALQPTPASGIKELPLGDWLHVAHRLRGEEKETVAAHRARLESLPMRRFHLVLEACDAAVCVGLGTLQGELFGLFDIFTPAPLRNRGYSKEVTQALLAIAVREGATLAFLQVDESNAPARRIYEGLGFQTVYSYWYRVKNS
jgi:GNAT superfamily N-acetyltransferase